MTEEEFIERCTRMARFQCEALGENPGPWAFSGFLWAAWVSVTFPRWWAEWQAGAGHIEKVMADSPEWLEGMRNEIQEQLINPQEKEPAWHV